MRFAALLLLAGLGVAAAPAVGLASGRELPERYRRPPWSKASLTVGHPNAGWQARAKKLRRTRQLRVKAGSEERVYGHPALVLMLRRSARDVARSAKGAVMLVGDLSTREGGALSGHHSHQSGRDADVGFYALDAAGKRVLPEAFVSYGADGRARDGSGLVFDDRTNALLLLAWAKDQRAGLRRVFVANALRRRLIAQGRKLSGWEAHAAAVERLLEQPENASTHDDHFHVRIACPPGQEAICREESR